MTSVPFAPLKTVALFLSVLATSCATKHLPLKNDLKMSDVSIERQLIDGFHQQEDGKWRWVAHRFAVVLAAPSAFRQAGAILQLNFYLPDSEIEDLGPLTLRAEVNDTSLAPETFTGGGTYSYKREISPELFTQPVLPVVFTFDKAIQPGSDPRELSAVVTEISLEEHTALQAKYSLAGRSGAPK